MGSWAPHPDGAAVVKVRVKPLMPRAAGVVGAAGAVGAMGTPRKRRRRRRLEEAEGRCLQH